MTSIESLNSLISRYLSGMTSRYLDEGEYGSLSDMINSTDRDFTSLEEYIKHELIIKIAYSWYNHTHELGSWCYDIGSWRYDPMFRHMYNLAIQNPTIISHMIEVIKSERRSAGLEELSEYSQVEVLRHYAYYHAISLGGDFFKEIIEEHFNQDDDDDLPILMRRYLDRDDDDLDRERDDLDRDDDDDFDLYDDEPSRIPPPA
jgi:hypothetical protein